MAEQLALQHVVAVSQEIDGVEMGVLDDGTPFLTGRSLARLCGVAPSAVIKQAANWKDGIRTGHLAKMMTDAGYSQPLLYIETKHKGQDVYAYSDSVCMVFLEYYGFESEPKSDIASRNFRLLAKSSLRAFIYAALKYNPSKAIEESWRNFHDRIKLNSAPAGYFTVFGEIYGIILAALKGGLTLDHHTIPDASVGGLWAKHWIETNLESKFGPRRDYPHFWPDYYPQSAVNPVEAKAYPDAALAEFRRWLREEYIPQRFPKYLGSKITAGAIAGQDARALLTQLSAETASHRALPGIPPK
jgi:hypothetical protein